MPVLGICLGLQVLASVHGATIRHAPYPVHGRLSGVRHNGHSLFSGIPSGELLQASQSFRSTVTGLKSTNTPLVLPQCFCWSRRESGTADHLSDHNRLVLMFSRHMCLRGYAGDEFAVVRYHSLAVDEATLPPCLEATAWAAGVLPTAALRGSAQHSSSPKAAGGPLRNDATTGTANGSVRDRLANGTAGTPGLATINGRSHADGPLKGHSHGSPDGHVNGSGSTADGPTSTSAAADGHTSIGAMVVDHGRDAADGGSHSDARDGRHSAAAADPLTNGPPHGACAPVQHVRTQRSSSPDHAQAGRDPDVLMGLAHRERPHMAVQFHPESVDTAYGIAVLQNFRDCTLRHLGRPVPPPLLASLRGATPA